MEIQVLQWVNENLHSSDFINHLFRYITFIGGFVWLIVAVVFLFFKSTRRAGVMLIIGFSASLIIGHYILKSIIKAPRPFEIDSSLISFLNYMHIAPPDSGSFPSLHATTAFCCAIILAHYFKNGWWFFIPAIIISLSRIFLCLHYPCDILGGMFLGSIVGLFTIYFAKLYKKHAKKDCFNHEKK